jgi:ribosome maturation factor RimP
MFTNTPILPSRAGRHAKLRCRLEELTIPVVHGLGLLLWGLEYIPLGRKALVRIYIDSADGVTVDQCALVSRQLGPALEVEEVLSGSFTLEVSSPGLERQFFHPKQLQAYLGRLVHARLKEPLKGRKSFQGILKRAEGECLVLADAGQEIPLDWDQIKKIHLVHVVDSTAS